MNRAPRLQRAFRGLNLAPSGIVHNSSCSFAHHVCRRSFKTSSALRHGDHGLSVKIGDVERKLVANLSPEEREKIPKGYLSEMMESDGDSSVLSHLQWMMKKDELAQDMLLVGHCAVQRRRIAMGYAELTQRPVQVLTISGDTTESDLKQKRILIQNNNTNDHSSQILFESQAPVRAAIHGHLLILDNLHFAERNVMPTLNNLLENRELNLEDGRLLVSQSRYQYLKAGSFSYSDLDFLVPVSSNFRVVALFRHGQYKLDPPLRSRFQIRRVDDDPHGFSSLNQLDGWNKNLAVFGQTMSQTTSPAQLHFPLTTALPSVARVRHTFADETMRNVLSRAYPYASSEERLTRTVEQWPMGRDARENFHRILQQVEPTDKKDGSYLVEEVIPIQEDPFHVQVRFRSTTVHEPLFITVPSGGRKPASFCMEEESFTATVASKQALTSMVQEHSAGRDVLLLSRKGEGKSALARQFASLLGYDTLLFPLYKEMTATDLLLRRTSSSSSYMESPLLQAARSGQICILDGVEKLSRDALASLQGLLTDREVHLPDGTKLRAGPHDETILPSFRVIALASSNSGQGAASVSWLTEELTSMFSTVVLSAPTRECLRDILRPHNNRSEADLEKLLDLYERLLEAADDCGVSPLSIRTMLRLVKHGASEGKHLHDHVCSALLADLLQPTQRAALESVLRSSGIVVPKRIRMKTRHTTVDDVKVDGDNLTIRDFTMKRQNAESAELVPSPYFFDIPSHVSMIKTLLTEWQRGERAFLLLGNQGTGKNKVCDRLCELANFEREYIQLHRDSTIGQLTLSPSLEDGKIVWKDSPLVRAVTKGRALVIDEADKAPLEVVAVLKSLVEDGELLLADGRRMLRNASGDDLDCIKMHPRFTVWVLANRPGRLFHGNDFYAEVGDCFSARVVPSPDLDSEIQLLKSYAPSVSDAILRRVAASFDELRALFEKGDISYPYSTREAVAVAKHLEKYPDDDVVEILHNVLDLDSFDENLYVTLGEVFRTHGFAFQSYEKWKRAAAAGTSGALKIEYKDNRSSEGTSSSPPPLSGPKRGKWDPNNDPHVGGNQWQGGTGGSDTAGLGGRGGPYRLDRGHKVHQVSEEAKAEVSEEAKAAARRIAEKALNARLEEIGMSDEEFESYTNFLEPLRGDIANLRAVLDAVEYKNTERNWIKRQLDGELDDSKLVEGVAGEKHVYKRRRTVEPTHSTNLQNRQKRLRFVVDCSGSMYRFNGYDNRLNRCLQAVALVMESLDGMGDKFDYSIVGHSGDSRCIELAKFGNPPANPKERLQLLQTMVAHSQFCQSGDNTLAAIKQAILDVSHGSDEIDGSVNSVVIAISDANLERYGISPRALGRAINVPDDASTKAFCIFIASFGDEAEKIKRALPIGRGFVCMDPGDLPTTVRNILTVEIN